MKRTPLKRTKRLLSGPSQKLRTTPLAKANPAHKAKSFERAYGGAARVEWVQRQPSVVSGASPCCNAHVKTGGAGRKADARWIVPLTREEHDELHRIGQRSFEAAHQVDLAHEAYVTESRWEQHCAMTAHNRGNK